MKREYPQPNPDVSHVSFSSVNNNNNNNNSNSSYNSLTSSKMWEEEPEHQDAGVDELLGVLGYKVRSSDMAQVAQKLEQLEQAMTQNTLSHLSNDTVHYNPADLSSWLQSMIAQLNPAESSSNDIIFDRSSDSDLTAIPGNAVYPPTPDVQSKRVKTMCPANNMSQNNAHPAPLVFADSQDNGVRLVHTLLACAEAVQLNNNLKLAETLVKHIAFLAVSQIGAMRKVATYFADALARRIYNLPAQNSNDSAISDFLEMHFYETCPYLKFAHFTANQAILEAFAGKHSVHVVDFSMKQGMQWPALMQALALRPGGPPTFRLTGIGPPSNDGTDHLQEVGWKLAQLAETIHVEFEYRGFVANSLADLDASMLHLREGETVAVNSVFEMHRLLARSGGVEKVMGAIKEMKPEIMTVVEQEANHNGPVFLDRFTESLHYYSTMFDSLESCGGGVDDGGIVSSEDKVMSEVFLGRQICNVVACDGVNRVERHETLEQWKTRFESAGFEPVHLGSNAFRQASMLLELFGSGDGYRVEESRGCLMLGWHTRPLITTSAWKLST